ncbi:MAG TPA: ATP-binding protein, partial [Steroidobacteraceae bacterium]|nr:ATP-binding protein [Steroidobacteraceae bacterium]
MEEVKTAIRAAEQKVDVEFYEKEVPEAFKRTMEGIEHVTKIVRAMKEFSHPDAVDHEPADINHAIETTLVVARNEYKYVAVVETRLQELPLVTCNIGELNQVFLNLFVNAAHAIAETGKDASTGHILVASVVDDDHVKITVRDNGCGIPERNLHKVFDPFFTT